MKEDATLVRNPNKIKNNDIQFMQIHGRIQAIEKNIGTKIQDSIKNKSNDNKQYKNMDKIN